MKFNVSPFCGTDCNNFSHTSCTLLCFDLGMNIFAFQLPDNCLQTSTLQHMWYIACWSLIEKNPIKKLKGNSLLFTSTFLHFFVQLALLNIFLVNLITIYIPSLKCGRETARDLCVCSLQEPQEEQLSCYAEQITPFPPPPLPSLLYSAHTPSPAPSPLPVWPFRSHNFLYCRNLSNLPFPKSRSLTFPCLTILIVTIRCAIFKLKPLLKVF